MTLRSLRAFVKNRIPGPCPVTLIQYTWGGTKCSVCSARTPGDSNALKSLGNPALKKRMLRMNLVLQDLLP